MLIIQWNIGKYIFLELQMLYICKIYVTQSTNNRIITQLHST